MKRSYMIGLTLATLFYLLCAPFLWAQDTYHWSKIRQGGKEEANTWVHGINDAGWFVGDYSWLDLSGTGAFRFSKNTLIEFSVPGAHYTSVADIGASSTIVGNYSFNHLPEDGGESTHAFMYRHGLNKVFTIDYPGAFWTFAFSVNNKNKAGLGFFKENPDESVEWGAAIYDYSKKSFTLVTAFDGETGVVIDGMNDNLDMVGTVSILSGCGCEVVPWVRWKGVDYELSLPDGQGLRPTGINNNGDVVGWLFNDQSFKMNMKTGVWETIEHHQNTVAKGWQTIVSDIANNGQMVATVQRVSDCDTPGTPPCWYAEGWWIRPKTQVAKK